MPTEFEERAAVALLDAIAQEDVRKVAAALVCGADPNITVQAGVYPLHAAAFLGRLDMVGLLLAHGAKVDSRDLEGHASLHMACIRGHVTVLQELLNAGADPDMTDVNGRNTLHFLARAGSIEALRELIQAGAQLDARDAVGYAPIHHAADRGNLPALRELVRAGSSHTWRSATLQTPLAAACLTGQSGAVKFLLHKCGADASAADDMGQTTLSLAALHGHLAVVKVMLRFGIQKLGPRAYPDALICMSLCGNVSILRELTSAEGGVHINQARNLVRMTPLHFSAGFCHLLATRVLLEAGADENAVDLKGETPLDVVDTMRNEHVEHGSGRRRLMLMLTHGPAYRARSWRWPNALAASARSPAAPAKNAPESTTMATTRATTTTETQSTQVATGTADKPVKDVDRTVDDDTAVVAPASARTGLAGLKVYRRPATSSSGSAGEGHSSVVASMIRYSGKK